jgi:hypothetical protein
LPAVASVPPLTTNGCATRHASRWWTGSHAINAAWILPPSATIDCAPASGSTPAFIALGRIWKSGSSRNANGISSAGMYTSPVPGWNDIGCQLWPPTGPGDKSDGSRDP